MEFIPDDFFILVSSHQADAPAVRVLGIKTPEVHHLHVNAVGVPERGILRSPLDPAHLAEETGKCRHFRAVLPWWRMAEAQV